MKRLNDFFEMVNKKDKRHWISLCGHLEAMLEKFKEDTKEYNLLYIPVNSFETEELYIDNSMELPTFLKEIRWIDDDFLNDESIPFDYEKFEIIDSGVKYVNPKHFSVKRLVDVLASE